MVIQWQKVENQKTCFIPYDDKTPAEQMTQLYYFLRDQMEDVERIDRQDASDRRHNLNSSAYAGKAGH